MFKRIQRIHLIGVGGSGMSGIAEVLLNRGYRVSGSDLKLTPVTQRLVERGARIQGGHSPTHLDAADVVVVSSAVKPDNPEIEEARRRQIPTIPRAEMLAELMRGKYGIAVAGTHGKTTTTSLVAGLTGHGGLDPTVVLGGRLNALGSNAKLGTGEFMVVEADESDRSFLLLSPTLAVVTNIDLDHMESYAGMDDLKGAFVQFVNKVPFYGAAVLCRDDPAVASILPRIKRRIITYGFGRESDLRIHEAAYSGFGSRFELDTREQGLGPFRLNLPGRHNVLNAAAAVAVGLDLGLDPSVMRFALAEFEGPDRRFELKGRVGGVTLIDDYGHHPTEITATLQAAGNLGAKRLVVVFQPHRFSRTRYCFEAFAGAFDRADLVLLADIYAAGEEPIGGLTSAKLVQAIRQRGHPDARYLGAAEDMASRLVPLLEAGDVVITMGAGSIAKLAESVLKRLAESAPGEKYGRDWKEGRNPA